MPPATVARAATPTDQTLTKYKGKGKDTSALVVAATAAATNPTSLTVAPQYASDLDSSDDDVDSYCLTPAEIKSRKAIWCDLHSDFLKEQKEKEARGVLPPPPRKRRRAPSYSEMPGDGPTAAATPNKAPVEDVTLPTPRPRSKKLNYSALRPA